MPLAKATHPLRQQGVTDGGHERQPQAAGLAIGGGTRHGRQGLGTRQQILHLRQQGGAAGTQPHAALGALEQAHAQQGLELGNALCQRRLGHVQAAGGTAEMQLLRHRHELAPHAQVDGSIIHMQNISITA